MAEGVDVSEHQLPFGAEWWSQWDFGIIRVHSGYREDLRWRQHLADCKAAGVPFGFYGYVVGDHDAARQAHEMLEWAAGEDPPLGFWTDAEDNTLDWIHAVTHVETLLAMTPMVGVYANVGDYSYLLAGSVADSLPLWVAGYGANDGVRHELVPAPARSWEIHQFSSAHGLDRNFCPDLDALLHVNPVRNLNKDDNLMVNLAYNAARKTMTFVGVGTDSQAYWGEVTSLGKWSGWMPLGGQFLDHVTVA